MVAMAKRLLHYNHLWYQIIRNKIKSHQIWRKTDKNSWSGEQIYGGGGGGGILCPLLGLYRVNPKMKHGSLIRTFVALFRRFIIPKFIIPTVRYSEGSFFRKWDKVDISKVP